MAETLLNPRSAVLLVNKFSFCSLPSMLLLRRKNSCSYSRNVAVFQNQRRVQSFAPVGLKVAIADDVKRSSTDIEDCVCDGIESDILPPMQTLRRFPKVELAAKVVLVRFDSTILLEQEIDPSSRSASNALFTIKYLHEVGAKVILISDWSKKINSSVLSTEYVADVLSSVLRWKVVIVKCLSGNISVDNEAFKESNILLLENLSKFKGEVANCPQFAELLSSGVDIFVNDSFSLSHKILASTVGVARFCYSCLAGFHFEESLSQLRKAAKLDGKPYAAIVGGANLCLKVDALRFLISTCDVLVFVGMMAFQIMHALRLSVPSYLVEKQANAAALDLIHFAQDKNISILYPKDFWCTNNHLHNELELFPYHGIPKGWEPVDIGPKSMEEINSVITGCKKALWIGPVKFRSSSHYMYGASKMARILCKACQGTCDVIVVGKMACKAIAKESGAIWGLNMVESGSAVWEFLKGKRLPGVMALDRAFPFKIDWSFAYSDPAKALVVDIGSGNGLFLLGMANKRKDLNFLGLEINKKLVKRCQDSVQLSRLTNGYFVATNATSTFRSIVASYPGKLILVSVQCPNPDFKKPEHRWRMLQRSLVEAVTDLLVHDGKVFLQSDIEGVTLRMKQQFLEYGKDKFVILQDNCDIKTNQSGWLEENPFGVRSDWEQHVLDRGDPMYRLVLSKRSSLNEEQRSSSCKKSGYVYQQQ